jgi:hypothetical protein
MDKRRHEAHPESVFLALKALGAHLETPKDLAAALRYRQHADSQRLAEPVIVAWDGLPDAKTAKHSSALKKELVL